MKIIFLLALIFGLASTESIPDVKKVHPPFNPTRFGNDGQGKFLPFRPSPFVPYHYHPGAFYHHQRLRGGLIPYYFQSQTTPTPFLVITPLPVFVSPTSNVLNKNFGFDNSGRVPTFGGPLPPFIPNGFGHVGHHENSVVSNENDSIFDESFRQNEALKSEKKYSNY
ncbi:uncharacterized protein [Lepeophtheirus salmonis]|uniref:uncharacterized protein n=1 Tax=Lepeophtheirus salmonis TaxID=72036 RepID=UPI001AEB4455|nr:uncharacterized protein LOC121129236 [Lepeophtheirus salmonis]